jgi:aryl-alcohol dehydrogenase-like predicted oxidoreductase
VRYLDIDATKKISKIGLGTWNFGSLEWNYSEDRARRQAQAIVRRALELGITLFDTAEIYGVAAHCRSCRALVRGLAVQDTARIAGFGRSERILGEALGEGQDAFLATKFYPTVPFSPAVDRHAAASAGRLGTRRIDLYQIHQPGRLLRTDTIMRAVRQLQRARLVTEVGISNGSLAAWSAAEKALGSRILSNQVAYSLVARSAERDLLPFAGSNGRFVIAHSPLARGFLTGKYGSRKAPPDASRSTNPLFLPENLDRASKLMATLREVAHAHSATPAQVALAWVIRHAAVAAIPGAVNVEQLEENAAAADIELAEAEYKALQAASSQFVPSSGPASPTRRMRRRVAAWLARQPSLA